jgi:DNA-binding response OmpR family regulator
LRFRGNNISMKKKVLVVEDYAPLARALKIRLGKEGFVVALASDGRAAVEALKLKKFDLVILDLVIPKKNGFEVLTEMRESGQNIPVVILTNLSQPKELKKLEALGVTKFFSKMHTPLKELSEFTKSLLIKANNS